MIRLAEVIKSINPVASFTMNGEDIDTIEWKGDTTPILNVDILSKQAELQAEYDAQEYARNRQEEYPSLNDLIVALWEGVVEERMASVTALEALRQAVKTKYPKPE